MIRTRLTLIACAMLLPGCSNLGVDVWQRDILSTHDMQFGASGLSRTLAGHYYFSREAASGGQGYPAGGCGCN